MPLCLRTLEITVRALKASWSVEPKLKCYSFFFPYLNPLLYLFSLGTYWNNVVPRGTASATKWAFVLASPAPTQDGESVLAWQRNLVHKLVSS